MTGTWECEPGKLQLDLEITEFCHLLKGHWILTAESGQVTEIRAGDSWVFPRGRKGVAEVVETVRKVYMVVSQDSRESSRHVGQNQTGLEIAGSGPSN